MTKISLTRVDNGRIPATAIAAVCAMCGNRLAAFAYPPPVFCEPRCALRWERLEREARR